MRAWNQARCAAFAASIDSLTSSTRRFRSTCSGSTLSSSADERGAALVALHPLPLGFRDVAPFPLAAARQLLDGGALAELLELGDGQHAVDGHVVAGVVHGGAGAAQLGGGALRHAPGALHALGIHAEQQHLLHAPASLHVGQRALVVRGHHGDHRVRLVHVVAYDGMAAGELVLAHGLVAALAVDDAVDPAVLDDHDGVHRLAGVERVEHAALRERGDVAEVLARILLVGVHVVYADLA